MGELKKQGDKAADAKKAAEGAGQTAADAEAKLKALRASASAMQIKLSKDSEIVDTDKSERAKLAEKVKQASHIEIPAGTSVAEAHRILDQKKADVEKYTKLLLESISKEKEAIAKKHDAQIALQEATGQINTVQLTAQN